MQRAQLLTAWTGDGSADNPNRPRLGDAYALVKFEDVTGQPSEYLHPDPNTYTVQIECEDAIMAAIEEDDDYYILWNEEVIEDA